MGKVVHIVLLALCFAASALLIGSEAEQCGRQAGGKMCPGCLCCSQWGWCGDTTLYCDPKYKCQSRCWKKTTLSLLPPNATITTLHPHNGPGAGVSSVVTQSQFDDMLKHRDDDACPARNFYTYDAFINAANAFGSFGTTGDPDSRRREIAAFFAQTSLRTTGGRWDTAPDGPYAWGYCFKEKQTGTPEDHCLPSTRWPCVPGRMYYGRGPIYISNNFNYGPAGQAIGVDLLSDPDLVATDPVVSFKTALWFWMTPQSSMPSSHDVLTGRWTPSAIDQPDGRVPGYGVIGNIISAGLEQHERESRWEDGIGFYRRYSNILGVRPGAELAEMRLSRLVK